MKTITIECEGLLFDLDGTLVDSSICIEKMWTIWAEENDLDIDEILSVAPGRTTLATMMIVAPDIATKKMAEDYADREAREIADLKQINGAERFVRSIPTNLWSVATSGNRVLATSRIINSGLPLPVVLVTADDVENGKPNPEPFLKAAEQMGIDPKKCVVFEDSVSGIKAGLAAGATVIGVNALEGFVIPTEADYLIKDYNDINVSFSESRKLIKISFIKEC